MAWTTKAYCELADVQELLDINPEDENRQPSDDFINHRIAEAQAAIDSYLGFTFQTDGTEEDPAVRYFDGIDKQKLQIERCLELLQVEVVRYQQAWNSDDNRYERTEVLVSDITSDCLLGPANTEPGFIVERLNGCFVRGRRNVKVFGVFGKAAEVPGDIKRACSRLAVHYCKQKDAGYTDQVGEQQYGVLTFRQDMPKDIEKLLKPYLPRTFAS